MTDPCAGDIKSIPFIEALGQFSCRVGNVASQSLNFDITYTEFSVLGNAIVKLSALMQSTFLIRNLRSFYLYFGVFVVFSSNSQFNLDLTEISCQILNY